MPRSTPAPLNPSPFAHPDFNAGLEAAGYLQKLDTSEERITARFQHGLEKADFAAHSEEFCGQQGVRKVHRSVVQFFHEDPTPMDPFVHVIVGSLPPPEEAFVQPLGAKGHSTWVPIGSRNEADGTIHFTVSIDGFWPITVVFDRNQADLEREDRFARINPDDDSESDPEAYLDHGRGGYSRGHGHRRAGSRSGRVAVLRGGRRDTYDDDRYNAHEYSSDEEEELDRAPPPRRVRTGSSSGRRGSLSAGVAVMSLARSSSRASRHNSRRGSMF
ncbi:hypothetical protein JCM11491_002512 [Sporobolomyces phaffii]